LRAAIVGLTTQS